MKYKMGNTKKIISIFITLVLIFTLFGPVVSVIELNTSAATKIKTQGSADKLLKKGAIKGIDVSKWQGGISWSKVAKDDIKFAFIRASYGTDADPYFVSNAKAANKNGVKVGAYHYSRFKDTKSMQAEAKFFIKQLKKVKITYPVVLDLENHYGLSRSKLTKLALEFIKIIEKQGYTVMLYSYQNFIDQRLSKKELGKTDLWVANYLTQPKNITHKIWQHTSVGKVKGISGDVDINVAYKDMGTTKGFTVNKTISDSIYKYLISNYSNYSSGLSEGGAVSLSAINTTIMSALQYEMGNLNYAVVVDGVLSSDLIRLISSLDFSSSANKKVIKLIQCRLFYTGYYAVEPNGIMDDTAKKALGDYQNSLGITRSLTFCENTISKLFNIKLTAAIVDPDPDPNPDDAIIDEDKVEDIEEQEVLDTESSITPNDGADNGEVLDK